MTEQSNTEQSVIRTAPQAGGQTIAFCDHFIEFASPWAGTLCKLHAGHSGPHSAHYPAGQGLRS